MCKVSQFQALDLVGGLFAQLVERIITLAKPPNKVIACRGYWGIFPLG
jgi:hypothetical protein